MSNPPTSTVRADPVVLFAGRPENWPEYSREIAAALAARGVNATLVPEAAPDTVDYMVYAPSGPISDFTPFTRLKVVLSLWAGVEKIVGNETIRVPLCRMVDSGLREGMVEWVAGHVLRYHLGMDLHITDQSGAWHEDIVPPLARNRRVGILGLGALGQAVAHALRALNFDVAGWSRAPKTVEGIATHHGADGLKAVMGHSEILVLLLPSTPQTENVLNAETLAWLPHGARVINPGRGPLIDDGALLAALGTGQIGHATLDVFRNEPLPPGDPYWGHPRVTVTPHIASATRADTAARSIAENIQRSESGLPLLHVVDRALGY